MVSFFEACDGWDLPVQTVRKNGLTPKEPSAFTQSGYWNGSKFFGGLNAAQVVISDPWSLRQHSANFFGTNLYARGLIRRLITNEINQGIYPECNPSERVLGLEPGALEDWSDLSEARFALWANDPQLCDYEGLKTFGEIQEQARIEGLIDGDVVIQLHINPLNQLPLVELHPGSQVVNPVSYKLPKGNRLVDGVELDERGRHVAFFINKPGKGLIRVLARGEKTGRLIAWLHYGTEKRSTDVRGDPLLSIILQSLRDLDRYRDAAQRKAAINATIAMFVKKTQDKISSLDLGGAARRDATTGAPIPAPALGFKTSEFMPGIMVENLQHGEELAFVGGEGTDVNFGTFESVIINAIAWANEVPPEILTLSFEKNYSASQAAINEFKNYINKRWRRTGETLCTPIFIDWLIAEALTGKHDTPGLLDSLYDPLQYDTFAALTIVDWYGTVKPATDFLKASRGSQVAVAECWSTNSREARALTGTDFNKNCERIGRENAKKAKALEPLAKFLTEYPGFAQISAMLTQQIMAHAPQAEEENDATMGN